MKRQMIPALSAMLLTAAALTPARADDIFTVTLNTAALAVAPGSSAGPFELAFQLTDGAGLGDANNTATLSDFQFGAGGSAGVCPAACTAFGGAIGNAGSSLVLTDNSFFNALLQGFTPGSSLSFQVDLTTNADAGGTPDLFAFSLLDGSGFSIPTLDPSGGDTLVSVTLDSANPVVFSFGSDSSRLTGAGIALSLASPVIGAPASSSVPEPNSLLWIGVGLAALILAPRKKLNR